MIGYSPFQAAFTSAPCATSNSIIGIRAEFNAARIKGPSPPWCTSDPCSIIHSAIASRSRVGGANRHSATHVSGPFPPYPIRAACNPGACSINAHTRPKSSASIACFSAVTSINPNGQSSMIL